MIQLNPNLNNAYVKARHSALAEEADVVRSVRRARPANVVRKRRLRRKVSTRPARV